MHSSKKRLINNTLMLYILQFSNYFFNFITVPYQTRILGPQYYGKLGIATALMSYFQLFLDFGFILSATEDVALNKNNSLKLDRIFTCVFTIKIILSISSILILIILCFFIPKFQNDCILYFLYLISAIIYSFLPDYLYRGLEYMSSITYRTILVKVIFTGAIFLFLKKSSDYFIVPCSLIAGNLIAVLWSYHDMQKSFKVKFVPIQMDELYACYVHAKSFFLSRIISTIYTASNTIIIGFIDSTGVLVGYYAAADRLMSAGKGALSPISDSIYPYMIKNKDFILIKRILKYSLPIILCFSVIIYAFAPQVCTLIFGPDFVDTSKILRYLMPIAVVTLPSYLLGFPTLGAVGLSKYANHSITVATIIHIILLLLLLITGNLNVYSLSLLTTIAECNILIYRIFIILQNKDRFKVNTLT